MNIFSNFFASNKNSKVVNPIDSYEIDITNMPPTKVPVIQLTGLNPSLEIQEFIDKEREIVLKEIGYSGMTLKSFENFQNDPEVVLKAIKRDLDAIEFASAGLKDNEKFMLEAVKLNAFVFEHASKRLKNSKEIVSKFIQINPAIFMFADSTLREDKKYVLQELAKNIEILKFASYTLKNDQNFLRKASQINERAFEFASDELINKKKE